MSRPIVKWLRLLRKLVRGRVLPRSVQIGMRTTVQWRSSVYQYAFFGIYEPQIRGG
jgi:hypothetical protein